MTLVSPLSALYFPLPLPNHRRTLVQITVQSKTLIYRRKNIILNTTVHMRTHAWRTTFIGKKALIIEYIKYFDRYSILTCLDILIFPIFCRSRICQSSFFLTRTRPKYTPTERDRHFRTSGSSPSQISWSKTPAVCLRNPLSQCDWFTSLFHNAGNATEAKTRA